MSVDHEDGTCPKCGSDEICPECSGCRGCVWEVSGCARCGKCESCTPLVTRRETVLSPVGVEMVCEGPSFCGECLTENKWMFKG